MSREICEACGRAVGLCTCVPSGSRQDTPCIKKTSEEIASEIVERETSDSLDALLSELKRAFSDLEIHKDTVEKLLEAAGNHRKEHKKVVEQRDELLATCEVVHSALTIAKNSGHESIDWEMLRGTVSEVTIRLKIK